jgi:ribonucleotide reductase alpha subunit
MQVVKRDGRKEDVSFDKVLERIRRSADGLHVNPTAIAQKVLGQIYDGVKTTELDELTCQLAASLATLHPDYSILAARIVISNHQKNTDPSFSKVMLQLSNQTAPKTGEPVSYINDDILSVVKAHGDEIDAYIKHDRDYFFDYFGFKTLERAYLLKDSSGKILERPQHLWMRVALALWGSIDLQKAFETYDLMSQKFFTHATPTLFNAGSHRQQLSSCYLVAMDSDSLEGIFKTLSDCAKISKWAGGIGLHVHNIRSKGALIKGTNGRGDGLVPMLRTFNATARYVNQGGRRNGSFAIYLEPWHADVEDFLRLKLNTGTEEERARDLFYALWIPDLFMKRVEADEDWTLFCPSEAPGLADVHSEDFEKLYLKYESEGLGKKKVKAQQLWFQILDCQMETGTPYLLYKDPANAKSNQQNVGTIKSSNLCVAPETLILTREGEYEIQSLVDKEVEVWNGDKWSKTIVRKTGVNQKLIKIEVDDYIWHCPPHDYSEKIACQPVRKTIYCTPYHKFILHDSERREAIDILKGVMLKEWVDEKGFTHTSLVHAVYRDDGRIDDTYCFNEPENHAGVFNGILTGNCSEIIEYSSSTESAVCNLASLGLPTFIDLETKTFDFVKLREVVGVMTRNLNRVIDINYYPTPETLKSNMRHRPIGIGVQGLADVFAMMRYPWDSPEAADLNQRIFEHIYYAAVEESMRIAKFEEGPYETFNGSPASKGKLQPDLWGITPLTEADGSLSWSILRENVAAYGIRNSLLLAPMPTASTSQILGFNECFEPFTSNLYTRRTLAGEYIVVNKYLMKDLVDRGVWSEDLKQMIIARNGSVQGISEVPADLQELYKTAWELKQRTLIDLAAARGAFICQSQSLNLFVADPSYAKLTSMHFYAWRKGLKTGCYYLRTRAAVAAQKFTIDPRFLVADTTGATTKEEITHSDVANAEKPVVAEKKKETRAEMLERLAREYEEEVEKAKAAKESGEGCLMCSG